MMFKKKNNTQMKMIDFLLKCFDTHGDAHATAYAKSCNTSFQACSFECVDQGYKNTGARCTERMA